MLRRIFIQSNCFSILIISFVLLILGVPSCKNDYLLNSNEVLKLSENLKNNSSNKDNNTFICCFHYDRPKIIKLVQPDYPVPAQNANIEGIVVVKILINKEGNVEKTEIVKSSPKRSCFECSSRREVKVAVRPFRLMPGITDPMP